MIGDILENVLKNKFKMSKIDQKTLVPFIYIAIILIGIYMVVTAGIEIGIGREWFYYIKAHEYVWRFLWSNGIYCRQKYYNEKQKRWKKPSREVYDNDNNRLFGFIVRQQGPKLVMITEIYNESRRDEIVSKTKLMAAIAENVMKKQGIDRVCIKDINQQLVKHNIDPKKFDIEKKQDVTIEVEDWVRGGFIPVDFTMGVTNVDNGIVKDGK